MGFSLKNFMYGVRTPVFKADDLKAGAPPCERLGKFPGLGALVGLIRIPCGIVDLSVSSLGLLAAKVEHCARKKGRLASWFPSAPALKGQMRGMRNLSLGLKELFTLGCYSLSWPSKKPVPAALAPAKQDKVDLLKVQIETGTPVTSARAFEQLQLMAQGIDSIEAQKAMYALRLFAQGKEEMKRRAAINALTDLASISELAKGILGVLSQNSNEDVKRLAEKALEEIPD